MIKLYNKETNAYIGEINETELKFLVKELTEETYDDQDYFLDKNTLAYLLREGADAHILELFQKAFDEHGEVEIRWERV